MELKPQQIPKQRMENDGSESISELKPEEVEIGHSLESLDILDRHSKLDLILVWRGIKDATQLFVSEKSTPEQINDLKDKIHNAGLLIKEGDNAKPEQYPISSFDMDRKVYFVAKNTQDLSLFSSLWFGDHVNDPEVYKKIGQMSGFPESAIRTYDSFTRLLGEERENARENLTLSQYEKRKMFPPELYPFSLFFYISRNNWEKELETVKKWAEE